MKDKKNLIIVALSAVVILLLVLLAYHLGLNAGMRSTGQSGSGNNIQATDTTTEGSGTSTNSGSASVQTTQAPTDQSNPQVDKQPAESTPPVTTEQPQTTQTPAPTDNPQPQSTKEPDSQATTTKEPAVTQAPGEELQEKGFTITINTGNTWGDNPVFHQLDMILHNDTDEDIKGWTVRIHVGKGAEIQSGWRGVYTIDGETLIATNEEHNAIIPSGGQIDIGLIISGVTGDLSYTTEAKTTQAAGTASNQPNNQNSKENVGMLSVPEPTTDDWLHVEGNKIVDKEGKQVWLTGVNWFGYNTGSNIFDGLWNSDLNTSIQGIADHGFNVVRIPMSAELILQWKSGEYPTANFNHATNFYLVDMNSLEIFDYVIGQFRACGMKIIIDIHSAKTDSMGHMSNMWYNGNITTEKYQEALVWMAERYAQDDTIIGYDLKNEPHGKPFEEEKAIWNDSTDDNNWKYVAEQTALKVLAKNPNALIFVEGIEIYPVDLQKNADYSSTNDKDYHFNWWGGNLRGVADYPIDLGQHQDQLVYSPHDYGPTVYRQPWFYEGYDYESLYKDCWHENWLYIHEDGTAPLLIGEWGGFMTQPNLTWMTHMRTLISEYKLHHTFWCYNANSGDTGGLVKDNFTTWDEEKYAFVKEVLWQQQGKFVGLDHEIPLGTGGNGITLSEAKGLK